MSINIYYPDSVYALVTPETKHWLPPVHNRLGGWTNQSWDEYGTGAYIECAVYLGM
jgi:hypothetical protein